MRSVAALQQLNLSVSFLLFFIIDPNHSCQDPCEDPCASGCFHLYGYVIAATCLARVGQVTFLLHKVKEECGVKVPVFSGKQRSAALSSCFVIGEDL